MNTVRAAIAETVGLRQHERHCLHIYRTQPTCGPNNLSAAYSFRAPIEREVLEKALAETCRRHPMLGAQPLNGSEAWQLFSDDVEPLQVDEIRADEDGGVSWRQCIAQHAKRLAYEIRYPRLQAVTLLRRGPHEHALLVTLNHCLVDCTALTIACTDLLSSYTALREGRAHAFAAGRYTPAACAAREAQTIDTQVSSGQLAWWQQYLPPSPGASADPGPSSFAVAERVLDAEGLRRLRAEAALARVTPSMLMLARYLQAIHETTGEPDILVHSEISRRGYIPGDKQLVACLLDALLYRVVSDAASTPATAAQELMMQTVENSRRWLPYRYLIRALFPPVYDTICSLSENEFNYMPQSVPSTLPDGIEEIPSPQYTWAPYRRRLLITESPDGLKVFASVDTRRVPAGHAQLIAARIAGEQRS